MAPAVQPIGSEIRFFQPDGGQPVDYTFAIIVSRYQGQWIWVKHRDRTTWELPAGHLEPGESPIEAARRELFEETGALEFSIKPVISYQGVYRGQKVFGMIFLANIEVLGPLPDYEIIETGFFNQIPDALTYPQIQPVFFNYVIDTISEKDLS